MNVYYAVDGSSVFQTMAINSISSLRYFSKDQKITLAVFGKVQASTRRRCQKWCVEVLSLPTYPKEMGYLLKWLALPYLETEGSLIFLDADTWMFGSIENLFSDSDGYSFSAAEEFATRGDQWRGDQLIKMRIDKAKLKLVRQSFNAKPMPVFNTSVMYMDSYVRRAIIALLPEMKMLFHGFHTGQWPFPGSYFQFAEEVTASILVGKVPGLKVKRFDSEKVTHFNRWIAEGGGEIAPIMHIGTGHMARWFEYFGFELLAKDLKRSYHRDYGQVTNKLLHAPLPGWKAPYFAGAGP